MADAASRAQRAAALEEKRRKLDELKKKRALRSGGGADRQAASSNLDEYIDGLLATKSPAVQQQPQQAPQEAPADTKAAAAESDGTSDNIQTAAAGSGSSSSDAATATTTTTPVPAPVAPVAPPPPKVETFTVSTQTDTWEEDGEEEEKADETETEADESEAVVEPDNAAATTTREPNLLSPEQVATEVTRNDFGTFLTTASKKVERLLGSTEWESLLVDSVVEGTTDDTEEGGAAAAEAGLVTSRTVYEAGKWTAARDVTDVRWSQHSRDVFLAAYHAPSTPYSAASAANTPVKHHAGGGASSAAASSLMTPRSGELQADGLVLIWSLSMPQRPEHVLTCASPVLAVRQQPATPAVVLGGCASGQVVVWDVRAGGGRYPVQTSALTTLASTAKQAQQGHVHPICGMEVTDGGAGLVTSSLDGRLNFWSMSNLREPVESIQVPGGSVSCLTVAPESESLVLGDDQGSLFTVTASSTAAGNKKKTSLRRKQVRKLEATAAAEDDANVSSNGHFGMVTAVAARPRIHTSTGLAKGFCRGSAGLVLTTGVDWTTQLWAPAYKDTPLLSWTSHSYDSVSDVQWNPQNPGIFATASSNGTVGLWNLAQSLDESLTDGLIVSTAAKDNHEVEGLTKLAWSVPDGRRLAVAGGGGRVHVLSFADEVVRPKGDEDARIVQQLVARGFLSRP